MADVAPAANPPEATAAEPVIDDNEEDETKEILLMKQRVEEMEREAQKLKELQAAAESANGGGDQHSAEGSPMETEDDKALADSRSVFVGNVDYGATPEEIQAHFQACGTINRVTILCDKFTGHPKGYAYVEFAEPDHIDAALALDNSLFRSRLIKVTAKRTNVPGFNRGRGRGGGYRGGYRGGHRGGGGFSPYRGYRGRGRGRATRFAFAHHVDPVPPDGSSRGVKSTRTGDEHGQLTLRIQQARHHSPAREDRTHRIPPQRQGPHGLSPADTADARKADLDPDALLASPSRPHPSRLRADRHAHARAGDVLGRAHLRAAARARHVVRRAQCRAAHGRGDAVFRELAACEGYQGRAEGGRRAGGGGQAEEEGEAGEAVLPPGCARQDECAIDWRAEVEGWVVSLVRLYKSILPVMMESFDTLDHSDLLCIPCTFSLSEDHEKTEIISMLMRISEAK